MTTKRICCGILTVALLAIALPISALASSVVNTETQGTIKVGYVAGGGVYNIPVIQGQEGYGYEHMQTVLDYMDTPYQVEFIECEGEEIFSRLEAGEIDLISSYFATETEGEGYLYSSNSMGWTGMFICATDAAQAYQSNFTALNGCRIGIYEGDENLDKLLSFMEEYNLDMEIVTFSDDEFMKNREVDSVDLYITYSGQLNEGSRIVALVENIPLHYVTTQNQAELLAEMDDAMSRIAQGEYLFFEKLYLKYYDYLFAVNTIPSEAELEQLQEGGPYVVGVQNLYSPFSKTGETGELEGIVVDFLHILAELGDIELEIIETNTASDTQQYDFTLLTKPDEQGELRVSECYLEVPLLLVERNDMEGDAMEDGMVGTLSYYGIDDIALDDQLNGREMVEYLNVQDMQQAFDDGLITGMVITTASLSYISTALEEYHFLSTPLELTMPLSITFSPNFEQEYINTINKLIGMIDESELNYTLLKNSVPPVEEVTLLDILQDNPWVPLLVMLLIVGVGCLIERKKRRELVAIVDFDPLTGVYSKHQFMLRVQKKLEENREITYTLVSLDIDNFKYINELYDYKTGTHILQSIGKYLKENITDGLVTRIFADNFVFLAELNHFTQDVHGHMGKNPVIAAELRKSLGENYTPKFSIGVYEIVDCTLDVDFMIDCSNLARAEGKKTSSTTICKFSEESHLARAINNDIVASMDGAIAREEFVIHYQPKVDLRTGMIEGAEALVRWKKNGQMIPPDRFIPVFEKNGFIVTLDYYVFEHVCAFIAANRDKGVPRISVNLSGVTAMAPQLVVELQKRMEKYQVTGADLDIELTETAFVDAQGQIPQVIAQLKGLGVTISMDDFGAGVSSLTRLRSIPIDTLKIDRALIIGYMEDEKGALILKHILNMANELNLRTVAEGVETTDQVDFLRKFNCQSGQGYYFSRPVEEGQFLKLWKAEQERQEPLP